MAPSGAAGASGGARPQQPLRNVNGSSDDASPRIAHTLTACCRCRQRKTRCDPKLPRCEPCERTNSVCEYWDPTKGRNVNRNYVVWLQHRVQSLEEELEKVENDEGHEDPEAMIKSGAAVRLQEQQETRFLGPSSGTTITRLVMQLAKQFTDAKTIKDIVPEHRARQVKELYAAEADKPTSKVYPLTSDVAAADLPNRSLTDMLVQLYNLKVQPMYPALHEPTLARDVDIVYEGKGDVFQNFIIRMVIAISLQKMDTQYAGLADSYYLAALKYFEPVVRPMDLRTLQAFAVVAEYSLLTPTRTAIYYIVGLAARLTQALGISEEKTITRSKNGAKADCLEIDMRRRLFWCIFVMESGLSHSLGRPHILAIDREHIDVGFFETVADEYITPEGIVPGSPSTLKKWIAVHFFKMRLLQLEIRRMLYQKKRPEPKTDQDPWFLQMNAKLEAWRDASPNNDEGTGLDKAWFIARYNTMIVFLYRPSPQVPRPSTEAAVKCFDACKYNIYVQRHQINARNIDLTWIFTQSIFMAINAMLWSLSYSEVRKLNARPEVQKHLQVAMEAITFASERWPGVSSAITLYHDLIEAIMKIYDKDGDVNIAGSTPSDNPSPNTSVTDPSNRSRTTSPATFANTSSTSNETSPDKPTAAPFGYFHHPGRRSVEQPPPLPYQSSQTATPPPLSGSSPSYQTEAIAPAMPSRNMSTESTATLNGNNLAQVQQQFQPYSYDPLSQFNPLPNTYAEGPEVTMPGWNQAYISPHHQTSPFTQYAANAPAAQPITTAPFTMSTTPGLRYISADPVFNQNQQEAADYLYPQQYFGQLFEQYGSGLNEEQQMELMQSLETSGMEDIQTMIKTTSALFNPHARTYGV